MRINSIPPKEIYSQYMVNRDIQPAAASRAMVSDQVEISDSAKSFSATLRAAKEVFGAQDVQDASRAGRISAIKQQIDSGTYFIPADKIADKILGR